MTLSGSPSLLRVTRQPPLAPGPVAWWQLNGQPDRFRVLASEWRPPPSAWGSPWLMAVLPLTVVFVSVKLPNRLDRPPPVRPAVLAETVQPVIDSVAALARPPPSL